MVRSWWAIGALIALCGCTQMAPRYTASVENIQKLRDTGSGKVKVGKFEDDSASASKLESISLRGSTMVSPYGKYTAYLEEALKSELGAAGLLDAGANVEISGVLLKNDVDVSGFSEASAELDARVIVKRGSAIRFDKTQHAKITFESSFAGAVAIPRGVQSYPNLVQKFLSDLYADPAFLAALK